MSELNYIRRKYTFKGEYITTESYDPLRLIERSSTPEGPFWVDGNQGLTFMPALKKQSLKASYVVRQLMTDGDFNESAFADAGSLTNWSGTAPLRKKVINSDKGQYGVLLGIPQATIGEARYIESQPVQIEYGYNTGIRISIGVQIAMPLIDQLNTPPRIYLRVKLGNHYLDSDGLWRLEENFVIMPVTESKAVTLSIEPSYIPNTGGTLQVRIYELISSSTSERPSEIFTIDYLHVDLLENSEDMRTTASLSIVNEARCSLVGEEIELFHADVPDIANARLVYENAVIVVNDVSRKWYRQGRIEEKTIQEILLDQVMKFSSVPRQKLNGNMRSEHFEFDFILQDPSNMPRLFMVNSMSYNTARSEWGVELLEMDATLPAGDEEKDIGERLYEDGRARKLENLVLRRLEFGAELEQMARLLEDGSYRYNEWNRPTEQQIRYLEAAEEE